MMDNPVTDNTSGVNRDQYSRSPEDCQVISDHSTRTIPLTQGKVAIVDDVDYASLNRHKWCAHKTPYTYYAERGVCMPHSKLRIIHMHRIILNASDGMQVDHINGDGLDNRRSNLRLCTPSENNRNKNLSRHNKTGFKGVSVLRRKLQKPYRVQIRINKKRIQIGYYHTAEEAARAYDLAASTYHGEFALTNKMLGLI